MRPSRVAGFALAHQRRRYCRCPLTHCGGPDARKPLELDCEEGGMNRFIRVLARNTSQLPVNLSLPVCRFSSHADLLHNVTSQRPRLYTIATIYMLTACGDFTLVLTLPRCPIQFQAFAPAASRHEQPEKTNSYDTDGGFSPQSRPLHMYLSKLSSLPIDSKAACNGLLAVAFQ